MGCRAQTNSHGKTSAAPAAEHSSPVRSLPLSSLICLCLLRLDRAFSCVSSQRLEEVGADRHTTCAWPRSTAVAVTLTRSPSVSLSLSLSLPSYRWLAARAHSRVRGGEPRPDVLRRARGEMPVQDVVRPADEGPAAPAREGEMPLMRSSHPQSQRRSRRARTDELGLQRCPAHSRVHCAQQSDALPSTHAIPLSLSPPLASPAPLPLSPLICLCLLASTARPPVCPRSGWRRWEQTDTRHAHGHGRLQWLSHSLALLCLSVSVSVCLCLSLSLSLCLSILLMLCCRKRRFKEAQDRDTSDRAISSETLQCSVI